MSKPPGEPCPKLHSGDNNKPASVVSIEDSCATCMPRAQQWDATWFKLWRGKKFEEAAAERLAEGDRLAPAKLRDSLMTLDRVTQSRLASIDWSIIPAPEPVYPPSWTVEDDRELSARWIGCWLVWGDQESFFQEQRQLYEEETERRRKEEIEGKKKQEAVERRREQKGGKEDEPEYDSEEGYEDAETNSNEEPPEDGSSIMGYQLSDEFRYGDQDQPSDTDPRSTRSHKHDPQLRKKSGREALGGGEFFSFATLDEDEGRDDLYHIDDKRDDDDDDIWMRISSEQPRNSTTTKNGYFPNHSRKTSQWTPDDPRANRSKRLSTQAVQGSGKRYDFKPFIPSQHHQR